MAMTMGVIKCGARVLLPLLLLVAVVLLQQL